MRDEATRHRDALYAKVDAFFARVHERHAASMECGKGCHDCCADGLTVTRVEADAITTFFTRGGVVAEAGPAGACAALRGDGSCAIYPVRPLVCRSHGLVVRTAPDPVPKRRLPVADGVHTTCEKNFRTPLAHDLEPGDILDQSTLSAILLGLERAFHPGPPERVALRELLERAIAQGPA